MSWEWDKTLTINLKPKTTAELKENIKNGTTVLFANVERLEKLTKELKKLKKIPNYLLLKNRKKFLKFKKK